MGLPDVPADRQTVAAESVSPEHPSLLRATLDSMFDPLVLLRAVRDGAGEIVDFVHVDASASAGRFVGMDRGALIGQGLVAAFPGAASQQLAEWCREAIRSAQPFSHDDQAIVSHLAEAVQHYDVRGVPMGDTISVTWRDVSDRFESTRAITLSEEHYRLLAENSSDVVLHAHGGIIEWISPSVVGALGGSVEYWTGRNFIEHIHHEDLGAYAEARYAVDSGGTSVKRARLRGFDGTFHWAEAHSALYRGADGHADGHVTSFRMVDDLVAAERELEFLARFDTLTGLMNRQEILARYSGVCAHVRRTGERTALLYCDVDRFKEINDTHGHAAGDEVLRTMARRICECVREDDCVARIGGDEMLVLLSGVHDIAQAAAIARKILASASEPIRIHDGSVRSSLSIGVALAGADETVDSLVARADRALYEAKASGRNTVVAVAVG